MSSSIRKNITLSDKVYKEGAKKAEELFTGNFSAYLAHLIINDTSGAIVKVNLNDEKNANDSAVDEEVKTSLDDILECGIELN